MEPARLDRKEDTESFLLDSFFDSVMNSVEAWVLNHALLCLIIAICLLIALFVALIFALTGVSATESGAVYNHMEAII